MTLRGLIAIGAVTGITVATHAAELSGEFAISMRDVSVNGDLAKYREDINLDDGPRLSDLSIRYQGISADPLKPDRIELDASNLGGDPYENMRLTIRKYRAYSFKAQRRHSAWYYDDIIVLPQNASINGSTGGDFHRFDIDRVRDDLALTVNLSERANLNLGFDRYAKTGSSTTTLDISRDEFELDKPIDELMQSWRIGVDYRWTSTQLSLEERVHEYENHSEMFLPGFSVGENPGNLTTVDFYSLDAPYRYRGHDHVVRLNSQPTQRLAIKLSGMLGDLDLDTDIDERLQGIDFAGQPLQSADTGGGRISRDTRAFDAGVRYVLTEQFSLTAGIRNRTLEQDGNVTFSASEGGQSEWDIDNRAFDLGFSWQAIDSLHVSAGWQAQRRNIDSRETQSGGATVLVSNDSDADGLFVNVDFRPNKRFRLSARLNDHTRDDPYSLASPSELSRLRLRASYRAENGLLLSASHSRNDRQNDFGQWSAATKQTTVRINHQVADIAWSFGGTFVDITQEYKRTVVGGTRQDVFDASYSADTRYVDTSLRWLADERWTVGGYWRRYDNDGSFAVSGDDWRTFVEVKLPQNYVAGISLRRVDYVEGDLEFYDARIVEAVLRLAF